MKQNMSRKMKADPFKELTWDDLREWAGTKILSRGRSYQRGRCVRELARTSSGGLIAWVSGSARYATRVQHQKDGLEADCTCPYGGTCKHAVAVVIEYLEQVKRGTDIPLVSEEDVRLSILQSDGDEEMGFEGDEGEDDEEYEKVEKKSRKACSESLQDFLQQQNKTQLISLVSDLANAYPVVREALQDRYDLSKGTVKKLVKAVRNEIRELSAEPGWMNHWNNEGYIPDYSRVKERLEALLAQGYADEVVSLGKELLEAGTRQVEMSHDEGETAEEISASMEVVFRALSQSSLSPIKQMLWAVEAELQDGYELCQGVELFWKKAKYSKTDWNRLANELISRLDSFSVPKSEDSFSRNYRRDHLTDWLIQALEKANRHKEIIPLCEREAEKTGSYVRLVKYLINAKRKEEAERWINKGIEATQNKLPGIASELRTLLREIWKKESNWSKVAALRVEEFFRYPSLHTFTNLEKAAKKVKMWPEARSAAMQYLENGKLPWGNPSWPLPKTGLLHESDRRQHSFPLIDALIDIAIAEKHPDEVVRWYDRRKGQKSGWWGSESQDDEVATAIADHYPDRALSIWRNVAEKQVALTQPKAYEVAAQYLRKAHRLSKKLGKVKEWQEYLANLRQGNVRKKRFLEVLDSLTGRKIVGG